MSAIDTRGVSRDSLFLMADISVESRDVERIKVRNLSDSGMMGEGTIKVSSGNRVTVDLRNIGEVTGKVAWTQGNRFGIAFDRIIDPKLARTILETGETKAPRYAQPALDCEPDPIDPRNLRKL
ncbi:PilZ domain-containing protein [Erythrobacter litoralis]|nr:PilZ domain-containing protein [Erythrobacter litoralis]MDG6079161.1 PilZ domain-containing protein [Erythrobacter litoralis]